MNDIRKNIWEYLMEQISDRDATNSKARWTTP